MKKIITYDGNNKENYSLILNPNENVQATIDLEKDNQIMLGEDQTRKLVNDVNNLILPFILNDELTISIKNDGDCLGIIIDVWINNDINEEPITSYTLWFEDYYEDNEDYVDDDNYGIFIVDPDQWTDDDVWGYDDVRNAAIDSYRAATKEELLTYMINGINDDTISDMHWFFLVDLKEETVLQYPSSLK